MLSLYAFLRAYADHGAGTALLTVQLLLQDGCGAE